MVGKNFEKYVESLKDSGFDLDKLEEAVKERAEMISVIKYTLVEAEVSKELIDKGIDDIIMLGKEATLLGLVKNMIEGVHTNE